MDCVQLLRFSPRTHWIVIRVTKVTGFVKIFSALKTAAAAGAWRRKAAAMTAVVIRRERRRYWAERRLRARRASRLKAKTKTTSISTISPSISQCPWVMNTTAPVRTSTLPRIRA
jgi:hypothetical protein